MLAAETETKKALKTESLNEKLLALFRLRRTWAALLTMATVSALVLTYISFLTGDSPTERNMRSMISSTFRALANLDSDDFNKPVAIEQTFLFDGGVIAYTDKLVYEQSETLTLSYSSPAPMPALITFQDVGKPSPAKEIQLPDVVFSRPIAVNSFTGFSPQDMATTEIELVQFEPGWHQIEIQGSNEVKYIPFFIQPEELKTRVVFVESTFTFQSYVSDVGLRTHYSNPGNLSGKFTRPDAYPANYQIVDYLTGDPSSVSCQDHLINADRVLKNRLLDLGLEFDVVSDEWLSKGNLRESSDLVILGAHNEYWDSGKFKSVQQFLDGGGNLLLLGGNTAWRFQERVEPGYRLYWGNGALRTPYADFITRYLGTHFDSRDYGTSSDFSLTNSIPEFLVGAELETSFGAGTDFASCESKINGASGHETDKLVNGHSTFKVLARGNNFLGGADVVHSELSSGGQVLNFGSVGLWHRMSDPTIQEIIRKFISQIQ
jgi:hypothetical protein